MLHDIRLHLDSDESSQAVIEQRMAEHINSRQRANIEAFKKYIPSVYEVIGAIPFEKASIFVDKNASTNIVYFNSGKTLYGLEHTDNIKLQVDNWQYHSAVLNFSDSAIAAKSFKQDSYQHANDYAKYLNHSVEQCPPDFIVVLGLGTGEHLIHLLARPELNKNIKGIVIYEPDWEVFRCSLAAFNWADFLASATNAGLQIFMQFGDKIGGIINDIRELNTTCSAQSILFYKHLNIEFYNAVINAVRRNHWPHGLEESTDKHAHEDHHLHNFSAIDNRQWQVASKQHQQLQDNLETFKEYYPNITELFSDYEPNSWDILSNKKDHQINMFNRSFGSYFSSQNPRRQAQCLAEHFVRFPNLDGLLFGYNGDKLRHYCHNRLLRQVDMILASGEEEVGQLPHQVPCLFVFGLGDGYQFEYICKHHDVRHIIICEPNLDMFYASLHSIDWQPIFDKVIEQDIQIYINIGEAGTQLISDMTVQFLQIGRHLLNQTFVMQSYQNPMLDSIMWELRKQLKVVFSMLENFDHIAYGISHTQIALTNGVPALREKPSQYLSAANKQVPVFIVGNGPSLDQNIDILKEYSEQAIVISCGTSLQALHRNGITPDFHAEVEQCRANFDWVMRVNDEAYLKQITLLGINGIHPDTCALFKDTAMVFKDGESSTICTVSALTENHFQKLDCAHPTVCNFVLSLTVRLGLREIYLIGTDLGFVEQDNHHSRASGYYKDGKQVYVSKNVASADLQVKGNFRESVYTKIEFNISRLMLEKVLQDKRAYKTGTLDCYNLSDGAFIEGTVPLTEEDVLIISDKSEKSACLSALRNCFETAKGDVVELMSQRFDTDVLNQRLKELDNLVNIKIKNKQQVDKLIESISELLVESSQDKNSLFFNYFFNDASYLCASLNKASLQTNNHQAMQDCNGIIKVWNAFLRDSQYKISLNNDLLDTSETSSEIREALALERQSEISYLSYNQHAKLCMQKWCDTDKNKLITLIDNLSTAGTNLLIDIYQETEVIQFVNELADIENKLPNQIAPSSIGLVFHNPSQMKRFEENYPELAKSVCLLLISSCIELRNEVTNIDESLTDVSKWQNYLFLLQTRAQDINKFSKVVVKPKFIIRGIKNAEQNTQSNDVGLSSDTAVSNDMRLVAKRLTERASRACSTCDSDATDVSWLNIPENEYASEAAWEVRDKLLGILPEKSVYMFKHYIAYPRDYKPELAATMLDGLSNRGELIDRSLFAFELLGSWQSTD